MSHVVMVMGLPASGKSTITEEFRKEGYVAVNRDSAGGTLKSLVPVVERLLEDNRDVVLDNLNVTVAHRAMFLEVAKRAGVEVELHWMQTSFEDCQVNALHRMWDRYGQVFLTAEDINAHPEASEDSNIFPIGVMFSWKKKLHGDKKQGIPSGKPTMAEGFSRIVKMPFVRRPRTGTNKAVILDYDGTLRMDAKRLGGKEHYPTRPEEVKLLPRRAEVLQDAVEDGYKLLGVTTQSGIGKGAVDEAMVRRCLDLTNTLLGFDIPYHLCPHHSFPVSCYCRKPQPGLGVQLIREHDLNPSQCIYVGDQKSDQTFAQRCGFGFAWADDFFGP